MADHPGSILSDVDGARSLGQALPLGLVLCDGEGGILWANPLAQALLGPTGLLVGTVTAWDLVDLDGNAIAPWVFVVPDEGRVTQGLEVGLAKPGNGRIWLSLSAAPTGAGRIAIALEDIGPRLREAAVMRAHARLAHLVKDGGMDGLLGAVVDELRSLTESPRGFHHLVPGHPANLPLQAWRCRPATTRFHGGEGGAWGTAGGEGLWNEVVREARPVLREGCDHTVNRQQEIQPACRELAVPVLRNGEVCAVLGVADKPHPYDEGDLASARQLVELAWNLVELKQALETAEQERALTAEVLAILSRMDAPKETAATILSAIRRSLGVEAAAIRLAREDDFTYAAHEGFPEAFIQAESCLRSMDLNHEPLFDEGGRPLFDCTCGLVVMGCTDPTSPVFTPGGSAWCSDIQSPLLRPWEEDPRQRPRDRCAHSGYRSISLIPIRSQERIVGLLQLNDSQPHRLGREMVVFLEGLATSVGIALERKKNLASLEDSLGNLRLVHEVAKAGSWSWDVASNQNVWSDSLFYLYGLVPGSVEPSYDAWLQVLHPDDRAAAVRYLQEAAGQGREIEFEWRVIRGDGSVRWLLSRGRPQHGADGRVIKFIGLVIDVTERKRVENALRESQERLRLLIDHAPAALAMFDRDMRYLAVSRRWLEDFGLGTAELLGRSHYEVFPEIPEDLKTVHRRSLAGEVIQAEEDRFVRQDGNSQWLRWEVLPWLEGDGAVGGIVIFSEDITARHEAEAAIKASQAKLAAALESMTDAIFISDKEGRFLEFNEAFATFHKFGSKAECARTFAEFPAILDVFLPTGQPAPVAQWAVPRALRGEKVTNAEYGLRRKDTGETWSGSYSFAPVRDPEGEIVGSVVVARDITERKLAEESLRESEALFRGLFEHSPAAVLVEDLSEVFAKFDELRAAGVVDLRAHLGACPGDVLALAARVKVVQANGESKTLLGVPDGVSTLRDLPCLSHEEALRSFREELIAFFEGRSEFESEIPIVAGGGRKLDMHLHVSLLPGHERDGSRVLASFTDLTHWKVAEAERQQMERELNHLQRLESLGRLAGGISHDMNNVLGAIMAVGSMLQEQHKDDLRIARDADILIQAAVRGRDLVKGLRDFSRKELESAAELDLNILVRREAELLEHTTLKRVAIALDLQEGLLPVFGEASSVSNALMNLCVNACDAMSHGGTLTMSTRNLGPGLVAVSIQDDGEGMSPEVQARALEPFFTTKPVGKGTGLGLSQVYGTVKAHGGALDIQSWLGGGTRVTMAFPTTVRIARIPQAAGSAKRGPARVLDILLVDDEELIRGTVMNLLQVLGHRAQAASSGLEALQRLETCMALDLAVLDLNMPAMDGEETLSRLRVMRPQLPVLLITGYSDDRVPAILRQFPNVRILKKPFDLDELQEALKGWL